MFALFYQLNMSVSKNSGTPKSSLFLETPIYPWSEMVMNVTPVGPSETHIKKGHF